MKRKMGLGFEMKVMKPSLLLVTNPTGLMDSGSRWANGCWYFVTATSDTGLFSLIPVTTPEMS